jgi:hypothetical protein
MIITPLLSPIIAPSPHPPSSILLYPLSSITIIIHGRRHHLTHYPIISIIITHQRPILHPPSPSLSMVVSSILHPTSPSLSMVITPSSIYHHPISRSSIINPSLFPLSLSTTFFFSSQEVPVCYHFSICYCSSRSIEANSRLVPVMQDSITSTAALAWAFSALRSERYSFV